MESQERNLLIGSLAECLKEDNNLLFAYLYGSFKDYDKSVGFRDIDIALYIRGIGDVLDYALGISAALSSKYNLPVDCIPLDTTTPLFLRYGVFKDGIVLFCKDEKLMTDLMESTVNDALDFGPLREEAMKELV
ncbi:MAG: nucleotidyltransferase [Candidatus Scalindua rubra]|uniref:Nucleotidyltransferase n=1 Tax=Candidatus Scalindua rubra TaxID=1872076 RepID=A0A1E3XAW4_9BACT|nr:MAG: nucleotidyltransferase [Candidatus Scalindua rubra]